MFWAPCGSGVGGVDGSGWGVVGDAPTHVHMHVHGCTRTHVKHDNFMQMAAPIAGIPGIPYDVIHVCACMHMHACARVWGHSLTTPNPYPPTPSPPKGGTPGITQNSIALELIEIFQFRLKI